MPGHMISLKWWLIMKVCRPDKEHLLCLILFCLTAMLLGTFLIYEDGNGETEEVRRERFRQAIGEMIWEEAQAKETTTSSSRSQQHHHQAIEGFIRDRFNHDKQQVKLMEKNDEKSEENLLWDVANKEVTSNEKRLESEEVGLTSKEKKKIEKNKNLKYNVSGNVEELRSLKGNRVRQEKSTLSSDLLGDLKGGEAYCTIYDTKKVITESFKCINLTIKPVTKVCLYDNEVDAHVSYHLRRDGIWEPHIVRTFQNILFQNPDLGVYDIGAHIGQYGLLAASMGHKVVAVEPFIQSLKRLHKAIQIANLTDKVILVQNGVSDRRETVELSIPRDNQGGISLSSQDADRFCTETDCPPHTTTILMDDLLEVTNFEKAIMKVDIEGHEHRAFVHSKLLLQYVDVQYIFMEWIKLRSYYGSEVTDTEDKRKVFELIEYLSKMGYSPSGLVLLDRLNIDYWYGWPDDIVWKSRHVA